MKNKIGFYLILGGIIICSCSNTNGKSDTESLLKDNPVTINWEDKTTKEITSYSSEVEVYSKDNRKNLNYSLVNKYKLNTKKIGETQYTRLDMLLDSMANSSIVTDGETSILFNNKTNEVAYKIKNENNISSDLSFFSESSLISKLSLDSIKTSAKRLNFDLTEDKSKGVLSLQIPSEYFNKECVDKRISTKVKFDIANETLFEIEIIDKKEDGTIETSVNNPIYQDVDGVPVKVGSITVIKKEVQTLIDGFNEDIQIFNSPDDIPTLSDEEYEKMKSTGQLFETEVTYGNPADLSSIQTIVEINKAVEINKVDDAAFKMLF